MWRVPILRKSDAAGPGWTDVLIAVAFSYRVHGGEPWPVVCLDEQPVQLHNEMSKPSSAVRARARWADYEYERSTTSRVFMFTKPLASWCDVTVRPRRTKVDWALKMETLQATRHKWTKKIILVCDHLNTHTEDALYEAWPLAKARAAH